MKLTLAKRSKAEPPSAALATVSPSVAPNSLSTPRVRYTFHGNLRSTRYGWLRLTPAYSVHLVRELLTQRARPDLPVLDPFCGTGTTLLACAELGIACATLDVNPFLVWLARAKTASYSLKSRAAAQLLVGEMGRGARARGRAPWLPALFQIQKWWAEPILQALGRAFAVLCESRAPTAARDLAKLAFCRSLISTANVSFGHQSMSFAKVGVPGTAAGQRVARALTDAFVPIGAAATVALSKSMRRVVLGDARHVAGSFEKAEFGCVVTSPPYANRMSYVRELRPYMYWLGYLQAPSDAGELDWQAIGGTWGSATSRVASWQAPAASPLRDIPMLVERIARRSDVLARYVGKYFDDMRMHVQSVAKVLASGGQAHYVVGNSKFFDVLLPVERLFSELFERHGFGAVRVTTLRKRTSKRELFEYLISATKS